MSNADDAKAPRFPPAPPPPGAVALVSGQNIKQLVTKNLKDKLKLSSKDEDRGERVRKCYQSLRFSPEDFQYCFCHFTRCIYPVVQDGPKCGLVAVSMASQYLRQTILSEDQAFSAARLHCYTKQGEMFSAEDMCSLAVDLLQCHGLVVPSCASVILDAILQNHAVLIPYDRDRNNEPCLQRGHKAHWAILSGALICCKTVPGGIALENCTQDPEIETLYYLNNPTPHVSGPLTTGDTQQQRRFVFANQGKSLRTSLWCLDELLKSNAQLVEVDPEIQRSAEDYQLCAQGIEVGLCGKVVILAP